MSETEQSISLENDVCHICDEKKNIVSVCNGCKAIGHIKCIEKQLKNNSKCEFCKQDFDVVKEYKFQNKKVIRFLIFLLLFLNLYYILFLNIHKDFFSKFILVSYELIVIIYVIMFLIKNIFSHLDLLTNKYVEKIVRFIPKFYNFIIFSEALIGIFVLKLLGDFMITKPGNGYNILILSLQIGIFLMFSLGVCASLILLIIFLIKRYSRCKTYNICPCFYNSSLTLKTIEKEKLLA